MIFFLVDDEYDLRGKVKNPGWWDYFSTGVYYIGPAYFLFPSSTDILNWPFVNFPVYTLCKKRCILCTSLEWSHHNLRLCSWDPVTMLTERPKPGRSEPPPTLRPTGIPVATRPCQHATVRERFTSEQRAGDSAKMGRLAHRHGHNPNYWRKHPGYSGCVA